MIYVLQSFFILILEGGDMVINLDQLMDAGQLLIAASFDEASTCG